MRRPHRKTANCITLREPEALNLHVHDGQDLGQPLIVQGEMRMRLQLRVATLAAIGLMASSVHANGQGFGQCKSGFADDTRVNTESRGELTIGEVRVNDRVWSFNEAVGKPGWSRVLHRVEAGGHYKLLADFTEPGSTTVTKACWRISRSS